MQRILRALWTCNVAYVVDILMEEPVPFEEVYARRRVFQVGSFAIPVASIQDLMALKARAGRPVDRADIEALRMLEEDHETS